MFASALTRAASHRSTRAYHRAAMCCRLVLRSRRARCRRAGRPLAPLLALAATGLARGQDALHERVNHALSEARPALLAHLAAASDAGTRPGELALVVLAGAHDGLTLDDAVFARAVQRLAKARPTETYDVALRLMVCEAIAAFPDRDDVAKRDCKELLQHRHKSGTFGYGRTPGGWDLSNTQYSVLGLRSAHALGVDVERSVWQRLATAIGAQQDEAGGFNYGQSNSGFDSYPSMTVAGIGVLAICRQQLDANGDAPAVLDARIDNGWKWLARNAASIGSPKERWSYYFHYGLERAAILCDVQKVGDVDWYATGASMLCDEQLPGGGWRSTADGYPGGNLSNGRGTLVPTSFAVLFLRRKFQKVAAPLTHRVVALANVGPATKPADVDACAAGLVKRGKAALPEVFHALRSDVEPQRRAAATALHGIAGDTFGYDPARDHAANRDALRKAELWFLKNP
jgi:hypothetical protein